jgi:hypothetical protein
MIVAALLCMHPGAITDVIGIALGGSVYLYQYLRGGGGRPARTH